MHLVNPALHQSSFSLSLRGLQFILQLSWSIGHDTMLWKVFIGKYDFSTSHRGKNEREWRRQFDLLILLHFVLFLRSVIRIRNYMAWSWRRFPIQHHPPILQPDNLILCYSFRTPPPYSAQRRGISWIFFLSFSKPPPLGCTIHRSNFIPVVRPIFNGIFIHRNYKSCSKHTQ